MNLKIASGLVLVLLLVGCDRQALFERFIPQSDVEFSKQYVEQLRAGDFEAVEAIIDPALRTRQLRAQLEQMAAAFPEENPAEIIPIGVRTVASADTSEVNTALQYSYEDQWLLVNVQQEKSDHGIMVTGFHVQPIPDALQNIHQFTLAGKGTVHYLVLAAAIAVPLLIILALVQCIRTPKLTGKWLWVIFILPGFTQLTLNWTDGSLVFTPYAVQLLGASRLAASPFSPWMLGVSIPVGAVVFLFLRGMGRLPVKDAQANGDVAARQAKVFGKPGE